MERDAFMRSSRLAMSMDKTPAGRQIEGLPPGR